ncbi:MAG: hypothetical protein ACK4JB_19365 [Reyranella sp.]
MLADGVIESSSTTGTANYELVGAVGAARTWAQDFADGADVAFWAQSLDRTKWEYGYGILTWGPPRTLTRATILKSSNAGAKIDWQPTDQYLVYSIASADALAGLMKGSLAEGTRPWWVRTGGRWLDYAAGLAVSWVDKLATGAATNLRVGIYDVVKNLYFPDGRRPWTAVGAANKTIAAADIGGVFTQDNSAANRTFTLPAHDAAGVGEGFRVGGLGLTSGGQYGIVLTPAAGDGIDGGADATAKTIPGGVRFDVVWDAAGDTWRVEYLNTVPAVWSGRRQTVAAGPVSTAGLPNFLPSTNGALSVTEQNVSASARMVLTAANGWDWQGRPSDRVGVSQANQQWTGLTASRPAATPNYLYKVVNADGSLTPGTTLLAPIYQWGGTPDTTAGQFTFNISEMKGYLGNGSTAPEAFVVFVGEAATDGSGVIGTVAYAYNGRYESAFTATLPTPGTVVTANHNIGVQPRMKELVAECTTIDLTYAVGQQISTSSGLQSADTEVHDGPLPSTRNTMSAGALNGGSWYALYADLTNRGAITPASWKYKFVADRGWG